jgi:hypothetical protein
MAFWVSWAVLESSMLVFVSNFHPSWQFCQISLLMKVERSSTTSSPKGAVMVLRSRLVIGNIFSIHILDELGLLPYTRPFHKEQVMNPNGRLRVD